MAAPHHPKTRDFNRRLRELMDARGMSGNELARRVGMRSGSMSKVTTGVSQPTIENLARIAGALRLRQWELLWLLGLEYTAGHVRHPGVETRLMVR